MNRSQFLKRLFLTGGGIALGWVNVEKSKPAVNSHEILTCAIAGYYYHRGPEGAHLMTEGDALRLIREPLNSHDRNAIALYYQSNRIGYIPRIYNHVLGRILDGDIPVEALIEEISHTDDEVQ